MKNPCKECLVQVNCTQVCPDKQNFIVLLNNARTQFEQGRRATTKQLEKIFQKYVELDFETAADIHKINCRRIAVKHPESKTGSISKKI